MHLKKTNSALVRSVGIDIVAIVVFVLIGRNNHHEGGPFAGVVNTGLPFLIGLAAAWLVVVRVWSRQPLAPMTGVALAAVTVFVGMLLRRFAFHRGTALAFVIVATVFNVVALAGWRAIASMVVKRRSAHL